MTNKRDDNRLLQTLDTCKLLICVGSGGVGKTTTAAALALLAGLRGRRVLVLTIDPAKRLLQALGLDHQSLPANTPLEVLPKMADILGPEQDPEPMGSLHAMMLDAESGAERMVVRLLPDPALREEVLGNRIYKALLPVLSAAPDYVALELISELYAEQRFDLIVLDTPPTHNAVDFLTAGRTLSNFINERVLRWFSLVPKAESRRKRRLGILRRGGSAAMAVLGRLFGTEVLPDIAAFFQSFREVLPALRARSEATDALMRSDVTRFVAVTAPGEASLREARHLHALLLEQGLPFAGFIINRVVQSPDGLRDDAEIRATCDQVESQLVDDGMSPGDASQLTQRLRTGAERLNFLAHADADHIDALRNLTGRHGFCTVAPQLEDDIHLIPELHGLAQVMVDHVLVGEST